MAFKVLVTDQFSPLGAAHVKALEANTIPVVYPDAPDSDALSIQIERSKPSVVVDTRLWSDWLEPEAAVDYARHLADLCRQHQIVLISLSSHEVFGVAQQTIGMSEQDQPEPDTNIGALLLAKEQEAARWEKSIIIRLPWVLDRPSGVLHRLCEALLYRGECVVSDTWRGSPVFIEDVVRLVQAMIQQIFCGAQNWGVFHLHASDSCSEAELADHVARLLQKAGYEAGAISLGALEQRFTPYSGWLKGQRCTNNFGFQYRSWRQGIKSKVSEWLEREIQMGRLVRAMPA